MQRAVAPWAVVGFRVADCLSLTWSCLGDRLLAVGCLLLLLAVACLLSVLRLAWSCLVLSLETVLILALGWLVLGSIADCCSMVNFFSKLKLIPRLIPVCSLCSICLENSFMFSFIPAWL